MSLLYQRRLWRSPHFNNWQKFYWTYLLYYCESFALISLQLLPVLLAFLLVPGAVSGQMRVYFWVAGGLSLFSGVYQILATAKIASRRYPLAYYLKHVLFLPFYVTFKNSIAIVAIYDYLNGENTWVVTPRDTRSQTRYRLKQG